MVTYVAVSFLYSMKNKDRRDGEKKTKNTLSTPCTEHESSEQHVRTVGCDRTFVMERKQKELIFNNAFLHVQCTTRFQAEDCIILYIMKTIPIVGLIGSVTHRGIMIPKLICICLQQGVILISQPTHSPAFVKLVAVAMWHSGRCSLVRLENSEIVLLFSLLLSFPPDTF